MPWQCWCSRLSHNNCLVVCTERGVLINLLVGWAVLCELEIPKVGCGQLVTGVQSCAVPGDLPAERGGGGGAGGRHNEVQRAAALDARLDALMAVVRLQYLIAREGGWGAVKEWGEVLSLGESHLALKLPPEKPKICRVAAGICN